MLHEEEEPCDSEEEQMESRIQEHMSTGKKIEEAVAELGITNKNWRISPKPMRGFDVEEIRSYVSNADWKILQC
ncbi:hypothetical protein HBI24_147930 [Parastagonospora nodorum]|nr:hypothetical protein HBH53_128190 [Parastagonospora nodorum]KAH4053000.1 hypothetical protein HBH49_093600 [Parastagonospora nodorum]KAH4190530.1 hypothetical protein HBH42_130210 [Parastagonospora nodorum]KAH4604132.1 hypothetical protein HBH82_140490 [Parastagonospora nodorum]KAH4701497.1 hypothetical protein HBH78_060780 [Parastagonospora nodorum]